MRAAGLLLIAALAAMVSVTFAQPAQADPFYYQIRNFGSGLCATAGVRGNGEPITQQPCTHAAGQMWHPYLQSDGDWEFFNQFGQCLDVRDGVFADRQPVQQWDCRGSTSMEWANDPNTFTGVHQLHSELGDDSKCLDVAAGSLQPGAQIQIYRCTGFGNAAQVWSFES